MTDSGEVRNTAILKPSDRRHRSKSSNPHAATHAVFIAMGEPTVALPVIFARADHYWLPQNAKTVAILDSTRRRSHLRKLTIDIVRHEISHLIPAGDIFIADAPGPRALLPTAGEPNRWVTVEMDSSNAFPTVRLPRSLLEADVRCVVTTVSYDHSKRGKRPIETIASYTHPRYHLPLRISSTRRSWSVDLTSALPVNLVIINGSFHGFPLSLATTDIIVAELCWLALCRAAEDDEAPGVWEDSIVQRATELDFGVRLPSHIVLRPVPSHVPGDEMLPLVVDRLSLQLGLPRIGPAKVSHFREASP